MQRKTPLMCELIFSYFSPTDNVLYCLELLSKTIARFSIPMMNADIKTLSKAVQLRL